MPPYYQESIKSLKGTRLRLMSLMIGEAAATNPSFLHAARVMLATYIQLPEDPYVGAKTEEDLTTFERETGFELDAL
jgi:hypothetical protein